jgi:hypothetical protein
MIAPPICRICGDFHWVKVICKYAVPTRSQTGASHAAASEKFIVPKPAHVGDRPLKARQNPNDDFFERFATG